MTQFLENKQKAVSYLLGELSGTERDALEERLFLDEDFSSFLSDVENDLIDEYVRGELGADENLKFEKAYLTNDTRREKLFTAQVLQSELFNQTQEQVIVREESKVSFWESLNAFFRLPNFAMASGLAVVLLFLLGAIWFMTADDVDKDRVKVEENTNESFPTPPQKTPEDLSVNNQNASNTLENNEEINKPVVDSNKPKIEPKKPEVPKTPLNQTEAPRQPRIFAFTLSPPTRSSDRPVLKIPKDAKQVRLQILNNFEKNFVKYTVEITNENGETIFKSDFDSDGKRPKKSFSLNLPNEVLKSGGYEITLLGTSADGNVEEINFYNFTVNKK